MFEAMIITEEQEVADIHENETKINSHMYSTCCLSVEAFSKFLAEALFSFPPCLVFRVENGISEKVLRY